MESNRYKRNRNYDRDGSRSPKRDDRFKRPRLDSRHNNRSPAPPSRVVHIRNIHSSVTEADVIQLGLPFGRVSNILMLKQKNQAFMEFERESSANTMVEYFNGAGEPSLCGRTVFVQFSQYRELKTDASHSNASAKTQAALKAASSIHDRGILSPRRRNEGGAGILHVTVENLVYPVTLETLVVIFEKYGTLKKIRIGPITDKYEAHVQYESSQSAEEACFALHGQNIYNGCCNLQIEHSELSFIRIEKNDDMGWDFSLSSQLVLDPFGQTFTDTMSDSGHDILGTRPRVKKPERKFYEPPRKSKPVSSETGLEAAKTVEMLLQNILNAKTLNSLGNRKKKETEKGSGCVLLVSDMDEAQITPDRLFTLFGVYGNVLRVKIMWSKKDSALIQMGDASMADTARKYLDRVSVWGKPICVRTSKHARVDLPKDIKGPENKGLTKDFTSSPLHRFKKAASKNYANIYAPSSSLHLSNIADKVKEEDLVDLFKKHGEVENFKFLPGTTKMAVITMGSTEDAIHALIDLHNHKLNNQYLRVSFARHSGRK